MVAWGQNDFGEAGGANPTDSYVPIVVPTNLAPSERIIAVTSGSMAAHNLAIVVAPEKGPVK
jgi:hypothetical protein